MDVLVIWKDGSKNVVYSDELQPVEKGKPISVGNKVKMCYKRKWYEGTVLDIEEQIVNNIESDNSDEIPLAKLICKNDAQKRNTKGKCFNTIT